MTIDALSPKLESLARCIDRLTSKLPSEAATLTGAFDLQDVLALNLQRAVQLCVDIASLRLSSLGQDAPRTMAAGFEALAVRGELAADLAERLKKAVGLRHLAVHEYARLDWGQLHASLAAGIRDFSAFARVAETWRDEKR